MTEPEVVVRLTMRQAWAAATALQCYRTPVPNAKALAKETTRIVQNAIDTAYYLAEERKREGYA